MGQREFDEEEFRRLVEQSSLGTPAARTLRARTSDAKAAEILRRARQLDEGIDEAERRVVDLEQKRGRHDER